MLHSLLSWWHYNYAPASGPWWTGADWPNAFILLVLSPLGWAWSRTKFWPLRPLHQHLERLHQRHEHLLGELQALHARHDEHQQAIQTLHERLDRTRQGIPGEDIGHTTSQGEW